MVLTFETFKLKLFYLIDFIGHELLKVIRHGVANISDFVTIELYSFLVCLLYSATFKEWDFNHLSLIFIARSEWFLVYFLKQWHFFKLNQSPTFFLIMYPSDVCTGFDVCTDPSFVLVRRLSQSEVCLSPKFVWVWRLYQSDLCKSDVCTGVSWRIDLRCAHFLRKRNIG